MSAEGDAKVGPGEASEEDSLSLLLVDDDDATRNLLARFLKVLGYDVEACCSGQECIDKITEGRFDLVITDRSIPDMSGDEIALAVKKVSPNTPVMMLSGSSGMLTSAPEGVDMLLEKPISMDNLKNAIVSIMSR